MVLNNAQKRIHHAALKLFAEKGSHEVSVSELAEAAGVARGTIYNNLESPDHLFQQVATQLADDMDERIASSYADVADPAWRLTLGVRWYVRRAHEEPHWGRFLLHFAITNDTLRKVWLGPPMKDLSLLLQNQANTIKTEQIPSALGLLAGATLSAILLVLDGLRTWREAGSDAAELVLCALGMERSQARELAQRELLPLLEK